ncbi:GNAT family N-acetyltransferase [Noviherbaspirillum sp.]|uniref:GNAT family N-acetyltransferase n=1 Tax=Noviherbaspirillum sp. TaxID=1926288 RepID=UPI002FE061F2
MKINDSSSGAYTNNLNNHEAQSTSSENDTRAVTHSQNILRASKLRHLHDIGASLARAVADPQSGAIPSQVKYKGITYEKVPVITTAHDSAYFIDPQTQTLIGLDRHADGCYMPRGTSGNSETAKAIVSASADVNLPASLTLAHNEAGAKAGTSVRATSATMQPAPMSVEAFLEGMNAGHTWSRTLPDGTELGLRKAFPLDTKMFSRFLTGVDTHSMNLRFGRPFIGSGEIENFTKSPNMTTLVSSIEGKIVGFANLCSTEEPEICEMAWLIHKDYQGKKIGKVLLNEMNGIAKARRFKRVENLVDRHNSVMLSWSRKQPGFMSMKPRDYQWQQVSISLEREDIEIQPPASMHAYVRPQEEAGEHVEKPPVDRMSPEESARLAEQNDRDEEELGY